MTMKIIPISSAQTLPIRHRVLWPNKSAEFCQVEDDHNGWHFGVLQNEQIICVASIYPDEKSARLRKFATLSEFQGQGAGSLMIAYILDLLIEKEFDTFWCDARETATDFYQGFGLSVEGERFYKSDVAYFKMSKQLN